LQANPGQEEAATLDEYMHILAEQRELEEYFYKFPAEILDECRKSQILIQHAEKNVIMQGILDLDE
jgi:hypothetical protein